MDTDDFEIVKMIDRDKKVLKDKDGILYFYKELSVYNLSVFAWLRKNPCMYIPAIREYEEKNDHLIVIEEYVDGETLEERLPSLTENEKYMILFQLLEGISFLHHASAPIIHRDIKPSNIMITQDGVVKIIDYDAAKLFVKNEPRDTVLLGTEGSAAPEQYGFGSSDQRTDIYGIGILIREMFPGNMRMLKTADKCTQLDPDDRYQTVEELKDAIRFPKKGINIPGFRTKNPSHMIIAVLGYLFLVYVVIDMKITVHDQLITDPVPLFLYKCVYAFIFIGIIDLFTHWSGIFERFPLMKNKYLILRILGYVIAIFILLAAMTLLAGIVDIFFHL